MKCTGGKTLLGWVANTILGNMFNLFYLLISTSQKKNKICVKPATSNSTTSNIITTLKWISLDGIGNNDVSFQ